MSLTDGDIAALAREAVDLRHPDLDIRIEPADPVDPYRRGVGAWTVSAGGSSSYIASNMSPEEALEKLIADLSR